MVDQVPAVCSAGQRLRSLVYYTVALARFFYRKVAGIFSS
jgi:hypothetical protein